jgi:DinB superfamily
MLDFTPLREKKLSLAELTADIDKADLYGLTHEMVDTMEAIIAAAQDTDVVFVPEDPTANDTFGIAEETRMPWTLGHVVVHTTASSEESAALALSLARGLEVGGRSRYEVPWREVHSVEQLRQRFAESRRMRLALLDAWPDEPHLDVTYQPYPQMPPLNAIARFVMGLMHDDSHLGQLREVMRQARLAREATHDR